MKITILAIGKKHESYVAEGIAEFSKRLERWATLEWKSLPYAGQDEATSRRLESASLLAKISDTDLVVLLDERGVQYDSPALAAHLESWRDSGKSVVFVIGGAYGVSAALQERADYTLSLSKFVFPHQLVRLILAEQLYRAFSIMNHLPYHHE
ncbi:MAG TPA: 23S rRNA (pseudouridine(1915)-N(3))-methyltransferase RlmH [Candidatus Saccharimonadales bacterium]|jgi:23S rRNA (pseudouridine1915-N3)-methyltransferase|nr:23S rRNA (pseudouridine(1915)-N(3))-methyltransferase RlmH [Candidatus Saccharimonadales bacterium]